MELQHTSSATNITLGKVDVTVENALKSRFNIEEFPTIKIFVNGSDHPLDYLGTCFSNKRPVSIFIIVFILSAIEIKFMMNEIAQNSKHRKINI